MVIRRAYIIPAWEIYSTHMLHIVPVTTVCKAGDKGMLIREE